MDGIDRSRNDKPSMTASSRQEQIEKIVVVGRVCRGRVRRADSVRPSQVNESKPQPQRNYAKYEEVDSDNLWGGHG